LDRQNISYNYFNKPVFISSASDSLVYTYNVLDDRIKSVLYDSSRQLIKARWYSGLYERTASSSVVKHYDYINSPDGPVALVIQTGANSPVIYYLCKDHLGSITGIMDSNGNMLEELNYDPWGKRRKPQDWSYTNVTVPTYTERGFTGHEHLDSFGLINMNGRIFDPEISRFLSPDPVVQNPYNILNYNRYSYCLNNPLEYTDPTGYTRRPYSYEYDFPSNYVESWEEYVNNLSTIIGPGMGSNGRGLHGIYYDWYSLSYRSTTTREIANGPDIDFSDIQYKLYMGAAQGFLSAYLQDFKNGIFKNPLVKIQLYSEKQFKSQWCGFAVSASIYSYYGIKFPSFFGISIGQFLLASAYYNHNNISLDSNTPVRWDLFLSQFYKNGDKYLYEGVYKTVESITDKLEKGYPIIAKLDAGEYTHAVIVVGVTQNGLSISNPNPSVGVFQIIDFENYKLLDISSVAIKGVNKHP